MYDFSCVDAHVHPFLESADNIARYNYPATPEEMVSLLKAAGITLCCGSVIKRNENNDLQILLDSNREVFEFAENFPDFVIPGILVNAAFPEESCREIEKYHRTGKLHWIGEIVPYTTGTDRYAVKELFPVYELAASLNLPINIHPANTYDVAEVAKLFPELNVVIAHPGEMESFALKLELMKTYPNLYLDICGTGLFRFGMLTHGIKTVGAERFLFGSDFPVCNCMMNRYGVLGENISEKDQELIFSGNFRRLTGL